MLRTNEETETCQVTGANLMLKVSISLASITTTEEGFHLPPPPGRGRELVPQQGA